MSIDGLDAMNAIIAARSFDNWAECPSGWQCVSDGYYVILVENVDSAAIDSRSDCVGWTGTSSLVFSVTRDHESVEYFLKEGSTDSYGQTDWDGRFYRVKPVERVVKGFVRA